MGQQGIAGRVSMPMTDRSTLLPAHTRRQLLSLPRLRYSRIKKGLGWDAWQQQVQLACGACAGQEPLLQVH